MSMSGQLQKQLSLSGQIQSNRTDFTNDGLESSTDDEYDESDLSEEEEPKFSSMRRPAHAERSARQTAFDLMTQEARMGASFVKKIGRNLAQMAINSSYDRLKSVNFLIPGPPGSNGSGPTKTRPGTKGDPSTDPRLRTVKART
jgi:hypothetical protein